MKITKIRTKQNEKPSMDVLNSVKTDLNLAFKKAGFITDVYIINNVSMKIGLHMRSFSLDLTKHDRNLQCNPHLNPKLTNLPTWDQRVIFNNLINKVFNKYKLSANIKSGPFTIRKGFESMNENDWYYQRPEHLLENVARGYEVVKLDTSEKEYIKQRNKERYLKQKEARLNNPEYQKQLHDKKFTNKVEELVNKEVI